MGVSLGSNKVDSNRAVRMRIDWRPSGGRGEYELAGQADGHSAADLLEWTLHLDLGALGMRHTELLVSAQGGKPRLRTAGNVHHVQRQLASALLLPRSRRSTANLATGQPITIDRRYLITSVSLRDVTLDAEVETIKARAELITVANEDRTASIDVAERSALVEYLHDHCDEFPDSISDLLASHRGALEASRSIPPGLEGIQVRLLEALELELFIPYVVKTDPVPALVSHVKGTPLLVPPPDEASPDEPKLRLSTTRVMRLALQRRTSANRFRIAVMRAYDSTCAFCGLRLPSIKGEVAAGCQAAHILPYAQYDLDQISNGMCLCPTHHWAFDQHLLVVDTVSGQYVVRVSDRAERLLPPDTVATLRQATGSIPSNRLPKRIADRPDPEFLRRLYEDNPTD